MGLYIKCDDYEVGEIEITTGEKITVKIGDRINIRTSAPGLPCGYCDYFDVEVWSARGPQARGSIGCPGGKVHFKANGGIHGISGSGILKMEVL